MDSAIGLALYGVADGQPRLGNLAVLLAEYGVCALPVALIAVWLAAGPDRPLRRYAVAAGVISAIIAIGVGLVLERTLARPRPFVELGIPPLVPHALDSSFPSDHTLFGVALIGPLALRVPRIGLWLLVWALLVGVARIMLLLHYPTDILGSAVLAFTIDAVGLLIAGRALAAVNAHWVT